MREWITRVRTLGSVPRRPSSQCAEHIQVFPALGWETGLFSYQLPSVTLGFNSLAPLDCLGCILPQPEESIRQATDRKSLGEVENQMDLFRASAIFVTSRGECETLERGKGSTDCTLMEFLEKRVTLEIKWFPMEEEMNMKKCFCTKQKQSLGVLGCPETSALTPEPVIFCIRWLLPLIFHSAMNGGRITISNIFQRTRCRHAMAATLTRTERMRGWWPTTSKKAKETRPVLETSAPAEPQWELGELN